MVSIGMDIAQLKQDVGKAQHELDKIKHATDRAAGAAERAAKSTDKMASSFSGLSRSLLRAYAEFYVVQAAIGGVITAISKGIDIIEQYNSSITTMSALITSSMKLNPGETLSQGYQRARTYATSLVKTLEEVDKHSSMSITELTEMSQEMIRQGSILDINNKEAVKGFTNVANALSSMIGNAPDRMRQIAQETRALITGQTRESDKLAKTIATMTPEFESQLKIHRAAKTEWEWLGGLMKGFAEAQSDIDKSWTTMKSSLETIGTQIVRLGADKMFKDIIAGTAQLSKWAEEHKEQIAGGLGKAWNDLRIIVEKIYEILSLFGPTIELIGTTVHGLVTLLDKLPTGLLSKVLYGTPGIGPFLQSIKDINTLITNLTTEDQAGKKMPVNLLDPNVKPPSLNNNSADTAKDAAKKLADLRKRYEDLLQTQKDELNVLQTEVQYHNELEKTLAQNDAWYNKFVRSISEFSAVQQKELLTVAKEVKDFKDLVAKIKDNAEAVKILEDAQRKANEADEEAARKRQRALEDYDALALSLDEVAGASKQYSHNLEIIKKAQEAGGRTDSELQRTKDLLDAHRDLYNADRVMNYYSQIEGIEDKILQKRLDAIEAERELNTLRYNEETANMLALQKAAAAYVRFVVAKNQPIMDMFEGMASALSGVGKLFKEGSQDAKTFADAAQALIIAQKALAVVNAVAAVASSASAPWPVQWANMAAMIGAMGSLLGTIGESINGGGSGGTSKPAYEATTVLGGESGKGSESIQNALDMLNDIETRSYVELVGIHRQMEDLSYSINNAVIAAVRGYNANTGSAAYSSTDKWAKSLVTGMSTLSTAITAYGLYTGTSGMMGAIAAYGGSTAGFAGSGGLAMGAAEGFGQASAGGLMAAIQGFGWLSGIGIGLAAVSLIDMMTGGGVGKWISSKSVRTSGYGIGINAGTVGSAMAGGVTGYDWLSTQTKKKSMGHVSRSTDYYYEDWTSSEQLKLQEAFSAIYASISNILMTTAKQLGSSIADVENTTLEAMKVDLLPVDPSEYGDVISAAISEVADKAVEGLFPSLVDKFQQLGEGAFETIARVVTDIIVVKESIKTVGSTFTATGERAFELSEYLIRLAGDLETLQGYFETYIEAFFTDSEKQALIYKSLGDNLALVNLSLPASRQGWRDLVEGMDLTTESGMEAYETLLAMSGVADQYYKTIEKIQKEAFGISIEYYKAIGRSVTATWKSRMNELDSLDDSSKALQVRNWLLEDEASAIDSLNNVMTSNTNLQQQILSAKGDVTGAAALNRSTIISGIDTQIGSITSTMNDLLLNIFATTDPVIKQGLRDQLAIFDDMRTGLQDQKTLYQELWNTEDLNTAADAAEALAEAEKELLRTRNGLLVELWNLEGKTKEATELERQMVLEGLDPSLWSIQKRIWALQDEKAATDAANEAIDNLVSNLTEALSVARSNLEDAFGAEKDRITEEYATKIDKLNMRMEEASAVVDSLTEAYESLKAARESMELQVVGAQSANYFSALKSLPAVVRQVSAKNYSGLTDDFLSTITNSGNTRFYGNAVDYQRDYYRIYNALDKMEGITGARKTAAEETVELLQQQIDDTENFRDAQLEALDAQLNAILGVKDNILTLAQAISQYQDAYAALKAAEGSSVSTNPEYFNSTGSATKKASASNNEITKELKIISAAIRKQSQDTWRQRRTFDKWDVDGMPDVRVV